MSYDRGVREWAGERHPLEAYERMSDTRTVALLLWILFALRPAGTEGRLAGTLSMRRGVEADTGLVVMNDELKGCLLILGFDVADRDALNWQLTDVIVPGYRIDWSMHTPGERLAFKLLMDRGRWNERMEALLKIGGRAA